MVKKITCLAVLYVNIKYD